MKGSKSVSVTRQQSKAFKSAVRLDQPTLAFENSPQSKECLKAISEEEVFYCPEESSFYSYCFERFVLNQCTPLDQVVEFGCGDGSPIIHALVRNSFVGTVHGYDLNDLACQVAESRIEKYGLTDQYIIHHGSFFDASRPNAQYLIANPPYLPSPDEQILMPALRGGSDGSGITCQLMNLGYPALLLMISSYSNPVDTVRHAIAQDYVVSDFMVSPLPFGYYSSEAKVRNTICQLKEDKQAFYSDNIYFLAGVLFKERNESCTDLSDEFLRVMTTL